MIRVISAGYDFLRFLAYSAMGVKDVELSSYVSGCIAKEKPHPLGDYIYKIGQSFSVSSGSLKLIRFDRKLGILATSPILTIAC